MGWELDYVRVSRFKYMVIYDFVNRICSLVLLFFCLVVSSERSKWIFGYLEGVLVSVVGLFVFDELFFFVKNYY